MLRTVQELEPGNGGLLADEAGFEVLAAAVAVLAVAAVVLLVWLVVRGVRSGQRRGPSLESRLQELDDLHRRGVLSDAEHQLARHRVLTSS